MGDTPRLGLPEITASQQGKNITHNEALAILDALVKSTVKDRVTAPPGSPTHGDCYLVIATATGDFAGHEDDIAQYYNGGWNFYTPSDPGWQIFVENENLPYTWSGTAWVSGLLADWDIGAGKKIILDVIESRDGQQKIEFNETTDKISLTAGGVLVVKIASSNISANVSSGAVSFIADTDDDAQATFQLKNQNQQWRLRVMASTDNNTFQIRDQTNGQCIFEVNPNSGSDAIHIDQELIGIFEANPSTIFDVKQGSTTDPVADAWDLHSLSRYKNLINEITDFGPLIEQFKQIPQHLWTRQVRLPDDDKMKRTYKEISVGDALEPQKRKVIDKTKLCDVYTITDDGKIKMTKTFEVKEKMVMAPKGDVDFDKKTGKFHTCINEPLSAAEIETKEQEMAQRPKFKNPRYGLMAEDVPEFCQAFDKDNKIIGIDMAALVGFQGAVIRGLIERIEALEKKQ